MRDYVQISLDYANDAVSDRGGKRYGRWIRKAAKRFLDDLKKAKRKRGAPFKFDEWHACDACGFIELLPHVEGEWDTPTIVLDPFQVFFIAQLFGFRKLDGTRRYSHALLAIGRKNGKSALAAAIMLYCFVCEGHTGPQVIAAATTGDQARIVWKVAKAMVEKTSDLREEFMLEPFAHAIACYGNNGSFRPISAKASTQDGLNPSAVCLDEIHAHKTHDLLNVLKSAAGARRNQLWLYVTTEGYETPGPWPELRKFSEQLLDGLLKADHFLALIYALDDTDDEYDEKAWCKANPLLLTNPLLLDAIQKEAIEAKNMPGAAAEFRIKRCNRRSSSAAGWVDLSRWRKCGRVFNLADMEGYPCWAALDLASTRDTTAWRLLWDVDGVFYTWGRFWVPEDCVSQRNQRGTVTYGPWVEGGHMQITPGDVTDYAWVERDIMADVQRFDPRVVAYDDWNASDIVNRLVDQDVPMVNFIQGPRSYHPAMQALERWYISGQLVHEDSPVLTWHAANLVPRYDQNMNGAPDRRKSAEKIDGMCTLLMCAGVAVTGMDATSVYESRGLSEVD
jgi:phage terminase large subunit-like protein